MDQLGCLPFSWLRWEQRFRHRSLPPPKPDIASMIRHYKDKLTLDENGHDIPFFMHWNWQFTAVDAEFAFGFETQEKTHLVMDDNEKVTLQPVLGDSWINKFDPEPVLLQLFFPVMGFLWYMLQVLPLTNSLLLTIIDPCRLIYRHCPKWGETDHLGRTRYQPYINRISIVHQSVNTGQLLSPDLCVLKYSLFEVYPMLPVTVAGR